MTGEQRQETTPASAPVAPERASGVPAARAVPVRAAEGPDLDGLARAARHGDEPAFEALWRAVADRLYRFLRARGLDAHEAEDVFQETTIKVHRNLGRYDPARPFLPWLFTIASREATSAYRRRRTHAPLDVDDRLAGDPDPAAEAARRDAGATLWDRARAVLSDKQYDTLWLRYGEELEIRDIAAVTGRTRVHVKVLLHRARARLAEALEGWEDRL
ncbi:MAG: RNA polymerase sigma factor [Planctomycetota bacterium]